MASDGRHGFRRFRNSFTPKQAARCGLAYDSARHGARVLRPAAARSSCACCRRRCTQRPVSAGCSGTWQPATRTYVSLRASGSGESPHIPFWFQHRCVVERIASHRSGDELARTWAAIIGSHPGAGSVRGRRRNPVLHAFPGRRQFVGRLPSLLGRSTNPQGEWRTMSARRTFARWLVVLGVLHGIVVCAGFFAPYDPVEQDRKSPYLPPMRLHLVDAHGHLQTRPFGNSLKLREGSFDQYEEDTAEPHPVKFFLSGARYRLLGLLSCRTHLL